MVFKVVSLFAGAGGLSRGFADRFSIELAVELDPYIANTYKANFPRTKVINGDVRTVNWIEELEKIHLTPDDIDVVIGGPPCQGFSRGNSKTRKIDNPLNFLWVSYLDVVNVLNPSWFVMENVPGIRNIGGNKETVSRIKQVFQEKIGYHVEEKTMLASNYGVPQNRRRVVFVGSKDGLIFPFPKPTIKKQLHENVGNAICGDLPSLQNGNDEIIEGTFKGVKYKAPPQNNYQKRIRSGQDSVTSHVTVKSNKDVRKRWKDIPPGGNWSNITEKNMIGWRSVSNEELQRVSHSNLYKRLDPNSPSITIANFRRSMICHPIEDRIISIREAARLQSFPDGHVFLGPKHIQQQMVANAVPPLLAKAIARQLDYVMRGLIPTRQASVQQKILED